MSVSDRYQRAEIFEPLAAAYVLGTLRGRARDRFETLMQKHGFIESAVMRWQAQLTEFDRVAPEIMPSPKVWKTIDGQTRPKTTDENHWFNRVRFWQGSTALLAGLLVFVLMAPEREVLSTEKSEFDASFVSVLSGDNDNPMMLTTGSMSQGFVEVRMASMPQVEDDMEWVLWAIPKGGGAPVAVGTLMRDRMSTRIELSREQWEEKLMGTEMFGVSAEPRSLQMTVKRDRPSGEIMYQGRCLEFI